MFFLCNPLSLSFSHTRTNSHFFECIYIGLWYNSNCENKIYNNNHLYGYNQQKKKILNGNLLQFLMDQTNQVCNS